MIKIELTRKPPQNKYFVEYFMSVSINKKKYDLVIAFLIWSHIKPHEETTFYLRPEALPKIFSGPLSPVKKRKAPSGFFKKQFEYYWRPGIDEIKGRINTLSLPLTPKETPELFTYCFNHPVRFSDVYQERLKELEAYSKKHNQQVWSAPRWTEIQSASIVPLSQMPEETDSFFFDVFNSRLQGESL